MPITVPNERVPGYPKEHYSSDGIIRVVDKFMCAWNFRFIFAKQLLGWSAGTILYPPLAYPSSDILIYAKNVDIEPLDDRYTKAYVTVEFGVLDYDPLSPYYFNGIPLYISESITPVTEFITLSNQTVYWGDATPVSEVEAPSKIMRMLEWQYTIHNAPNNVAASFNGMFDLPGTINNSDVYSDLWNRTFPAGSLLAGNPGLTQTITPAGLRTVDITLSFTWRGINWNKFPRVRPGANGGDLSWEYMYAAKTGNTEIFPYASANFSGFIL